MFNQRHPLYNKYKSLKCGIYTIEGIISAGKTTLGRSIEKFFSNIGIEAKFFPEYVNKDLLGQYISDMPRYAYGFQMIMLCKRIEIYRQAEEYAKTGGIAIIDRSIIGDMTFARMQKDNGNFTQTEFDIYLSVMKQEIQLAPTASLFLKCTSQTSLERINKRGIEAEINGYSIEYLQQLYQAYNLSISQCNSVCHVIVEWDKSNNVENGYLRETTICDILDLLL